MVRFPALCAAFLFLFACAQTTEQPAATNEAFSFVVIGDAPYAAEDDVMLEQAVSKIREESFPFIIHVGDYKGGGQPCTQEHDHKFAALVASLAPTSVFYTPGDNEWTDCDRFDDPETGRKMSDLKRLEMIRERFFSAPVEAPASFDYRRMRDYVFDATWVYGGVRFMTLHQVATNNGRDWVVGDPPAEALAEVEERDAANLAWLSEITAQAKSEGASALVIAMQADPTDVDSKPEDLMCTDVAASDDHACDAHTDLRAAIRDAANDYGGPVLLIHGDTAPFTFNQSFSGEEAPTLWRLNAAGDSGIGSTGIPYGTRDVTKVTIDPAAENPFSAVGLLTGKTPKNK